MSKFVKLFSEIEKVSKEFVEVGNDVIIFKGIEYKDIKDEWRESGLVCINKFIRNMGYGGYNRSEDYEVVYVNGKGEKVYKSYYDLILVRDKKLYGNNNMDKLFMNEIELFMKKKNSNKILFSEFMNNFNNRGLFGLLYNFRGSWLVNSYNDRFENWVRRSKLLVKEKINIYNRLWIVK